MIIDLKTILIEQFTSMFENHLGLIAIIFAVAIVAFTFRHYIAFYLDLTKRGENKLTEKTILIPILIVIGTMSYLYIKQQYFMLSLGISVILTYFLYLIGILDMLAQRLEDRYGR
jgi:hypothetical protein